MVEICWLGSVCKREHLIECAFNASNQYFFNGELYNL